MGIIHFIRLSGSRSYRFGLWLELCPSINPSIKMFFEVFSWESDPYETDPQMQKSIHLGFYIIIRALRILFWNTAAPRGQKDPFISARLSFHSHFKQFQAFKYSCRPFVWKESIRARSPGILHTPEVPSRRNMVSTTYTPYKK